MAWHCVALDCSSVTLREVALAPCSSDISVKNALHSSVCTPFFAYDIANASNACPYELGTLRALHLPHLSDWYFRPVATGDLMNGRLWQSCTITSLVILVEEKAGQRIR
jgi:hypothetical protein